MTRTLIPFVFGRIRVGAHEGQDHIGVMRTRRPHLLSVDDEVVAVGVRPGDRRGAQRGEVRPGAGLAHPERR